MSRNKVSKGALVLGALVLFTVGQALFLSNSGCSSGAVCYRVTDCPIGDRCVSGTCTHRIEVSNDGTAASSGTSATAGSSASATAGSSATATAGSSGSGTMTGALSNAAGDAGVSEAGTGGV